MGSQTGLSSNATWEMEGNQSEIQYGFSVSIAGDVNGDGFSDVIIGAPNFTNNESNEGKVFVYSGSVTGLLSNPSWVKEGNQTAINMGWSVATAGDVNGDGYSDIIIGSPGWTNGESSEGGASVFLGSSTGVSNTVAWSNEGNQAGAKFGWSVATAGDVNGDGYSDVIIGAIDWTNGEIAEGKAFCFHGSPTGLLTTPDWSVEGNQTTAQFGYCVSFAGDVNGDGYSDVIVGVPYHDDGYEDEGGFFVYYGNSSSGKDSRVRQNNPITNNIIDAGNLTKSNGEAEIGIKTKSPFGRADGRIVYEFSKNGEPFSSGTTLANGFSYYGATVFEDLGNNANGILILATVNGLASQYSDAFRWRVRKEFSLVNNPYQKYGPWKYYSAYSPISPYAFRPRVFIQLNIIAQIKILLEGPFNSTTGGMHTNINGNIPNTSPYSEDPVTITTIPVTMVDWV